MTRTRLLCQKESELKKQRGSKVRARARARSSYVEWTQDEPTSKVRVAQDLELGLQ